MKIHTEADGIAIESRRGHVGNAVAAPPRKQDNAPASKRATILGMQTAGRGSNRCAVFSGASVARAWRSGRSDRAGCYRLLDKLAETVDLCLQLRQLQIVLRHTLEVMPLRLIACTGRPGLKFGSFCSVLIPHRHLLKLLTHAHRGKRL